MPELLKRAALPLRRYFNPRFQAVSNGIDSLSRDIGSLRQDVNQLREPIEQLREPIEQLRVLVEPPDQVVVDRARQADYLARVDVSQHNRSHRPAEFDGLQCRAVSAAQCEDERYVNWWRLLLHVPETLSPGDEGAPMFYNRKLWEWAFIVQSIEQLDLMRPGKAAVGFGCGNEAIPAMLASRGVDVLATDQTISSGSQWAASGELMSGLDGLARDHLIDRSALSERVRTRHVDMNDVPDDLGEFDIAWSSCVIEHLGSPARGLDFVLESLALLRPGGVAVHTTELELTRKAETADYGNCAVYRLEDLQDFAARVASAGYEASFNFHVAMESPHDRWISLVSAPGGTVLEDVDHLKLVIGDSVSTSVSTSFGLIIRKPGSTNPDPESRN